MANLQIPHIKAIRAGNAQPADYARAFQAIEDSVNNMGQQTNSQPVGVTPAPTAPSALAVTGGAGYFRAHITDNSPSFRGKENFLEVSEDENDWTTPHKIHLGASTSWYGQLGEKNLHFRAYSGHDTLRAMPRYSRHL